MNEPMVRFKGAARIAAAAITVLILLCCFHVTVNAQAPVDSIAILYDASHDQQFSPNDEAGFKLILDMVNASTKYTVRVNTDPIENATLSDVDLLILADPDISYDFVPNEVSSIAEMLANGSSLLLLGNPVIGNNSKYWDDFALQDMGDNIALNKLLDALNITGPRFSINETQTISWSDAMFDYEHAVNETSPWVMRLDTSTWDSGHPIFKNINELIVMTATLKPLDLVSSIATGHESSFAQFRKTVSYLANYSFPNMTLEEFAERPLSYSAINGTFPPWMSAFEYNESRIVISGSAIMFSGLVMDVYESESQWFYTADNARLFMNMLDWLTEGFVEPPGAIYPMLMISLTILAVGAVYYIFKKVR
nr:MAG: hypothetical protein AM324_04140 [Candidatus Thorarchaeota archaeon SMTZ1-83]